MAKQTYQRLSRRVRDLLKTDESADVEFKQSVSGLDSSDIVAFANSKAGGTILIGVKEAVSPDGLQRGEPIGCPISDECRLKIMNKAMNCSPPVPVELFIENLSIKAFYRLEIPPGPLRPYATSGGTYKIRVDGRVKPIPPQDLLFMFVERESGAFKEKFLGATEELQDELNLAAGSIDDIKSTVESEIKGISSELGWADSKVDETRDSIDYVRSEIGDLQQRVLALLHHNNISDPVKETARDFIVQSVEKQLRENPRLFKRAADGKKLSASVSGRGMDLFTQEELRGILMSVVTKMQAEQNSGGQ